MKKIKEITSLVLVITVLQLVGCCDAEYFTYNLNIDSNISETRIPANTPFEITIEIPDIIMSNEGVENDISNIDYEFEITAFNYINDTTIFYVDYEVLTTDLIITSERIEDNESFVIGKPTPVNNGREMRFEITPTITDTILIAIGVNGGQEGRGSCAGLHQLILSTNQLSIENSDFNISKIGLTESLGNLILLDVN